MDLLDSLKRDAQIIQALHVARYALVTRRGTQTNVQQRGRFRARRIRRVLVKGE